MDTTDEKLKTYGFVAVVVGFLLFVLADSGVLSWSWLKKSSSDLQSQQETIDELKAELAALKSNSKIRRERLHSLVNQLHEIDSSIQKEEQEIQSLQKEKQILEVKEKLKRNLASSYKKVYENRAAQWNFESWNEVINKVQEITQESATINKEGSIVSFHQNDAFSDTSDFMKPQGLRVVQAIAAGAKKLNADSISVAYAGEQKEKAQVARRYFKSLLGEEVPVTTVKVAENFVKAPEKVEFWVNLKTEGNP